MAVVAVLAEAEDVVCPPPAPELPPLVFWCCSLLGALLSLEPPSKLPFCFDASTESYQAYNKIGGTRK